jgi:hypothetical protein
MIGAVNSWVLAIDNVSSIQPWLSDSLCRLATGGGFATRTLYSNDEETFLDAQRPIVLNGIEDFVTRGDLMDRSLFLHMPAIEEEDRRIEAEFWREFEAAWPILLGSLLDAVAGGLRQFPNVRLEKLPRMADFAMWGEAVTRAMGSTPGRFLEVYGENRRHANELVLEDSPVAGAVRELVTRGSWTGTSTELLTELGHVAGEKVVESKRWPRSPRALSGTLRRLAPTLRGAGVDVRFERDPDHSRARTILIENMGNQPSGPPGPSGTPSFAEPESDGRAERSSATVRQPSGANPGKTRVADRSDGSDGQIPTLSGDLPF